MKLNLNVEEVKRLYEYYESTRKVAKELNCNYVTIIHFMHKHGIPFTKNKIPKWKREKAIELYNQNVLWKDIAEQIDTSIDTIRNILKENGITFQRGSKNHSRKYASIQERYAAKKIRSKNYNHKILKILPCPICGKEMKIIPHHKKRKFCSIACRKLHEKTKFPQKVIDNIILLYLNGMKLLDIAKTLNASSATILKYVKENNIVQRKPEGRIYSLNHNFFETIDTEEKAYFLGLLSADGCVSKNSAISISLKHSDRKHLEKFLQAIGANNPIRDFFSYGFNKDHSKRFLQSGVYISSKKMFSDLNKLGIVPKKSLILRPYYNIKDELKRHFFRGLIDGDGWISCGKDKKWSIGLCGSYWVVDFFQKFVKEHIQTKAKILTDKNIFRFSVSGNVLCKLTAELIYKDSKIYLDRKMEKYQTLSKLKTRSLICKYSKEQLLSLKEKHKTWSNVEKYIGLAKGSIYNILKRSSESAST